MLLAFAPELALAQWQPSGPYGGDAALVRAIPRLPGFVIAGAHNGLLFTSENGGTSWVNVAFKGELLGTLHALEIDPRSPGTWYAGMEGDHARTSGVYKTIDKGQSWELISRLSGKAIWSLALSPTNPDVIAAGTDDGIYRSLNAGANWDRISPPENDEFRSVVSLAFDPANREILYAGTTHLPWRTRDGGSSWEMIHAGMIDDSDVFSIQVDTRNPASVYLSACSGLYWSSDGANHWTKLVTPPGTFRTWFVALDPRHNGVVFAGTTGGLLRSDDGGKIFRVINAEAVKSISFDPNARERIYFASSTGGLMISRDGGRTLRSSNIGFTNRTFSVLTGALGVLYVSSMFEPSTGGVYQSDSLGQQWQRSTAGQDPREVRLMTAAPDQLGTLFAVGYRGVQKSKDGGKTWIENASPDPGGQLTSLLALPRDILLAATGHGLFRSQDGGIWNAVIISDTEAISALTMSGNQMVAALSPHEAFVSADDGLTWQACGKPSPATVWYGLAFDTAPMNRGSQTALAATAAGLFRSTDSCRSWLRVSGGLLNATVSLVVFHPTRSREAFVSQDGELLRSTDGGLNWEALDDRSNGKLWPSSLMVMPTEPNRLFALFPRRGVASKTLKP